MASTPQESDFVVLDGGREVAHLHHRWQPQDPVGEDLIDLGDGLGQGGQVVAAQVNHGRSGHRQRRGRGGALGRSSPTVCLTGSAAISGRNAASPWSRSLAGVAPAGRDPGGQAGHQGDRALAPWGRPAVRSTWRAEAGSRSRGDRASGCTCTASAAAATSSWTPHRGRPAHNDRDVGRLVLVEDAFHLPGDPAERPGCRHAPLLPP